MAYNCDIDFKYCYPATYQLPNTYVPQCNPQSYNNSYYNAYQNQLRNLQNREVTMEYWSRQLQYFRNLLKNFSAEIESPEDLKKLLETCNYNENSKKCFEKRQTFFNVDKKSQCCCDSCLEKKLLQLCNALSIPRPCNKCNCSACRNRQNYQNYPGYCYIPWQANNETSAPAYSYYYYYPYQMRAPPNYCQTTPQQFTNNNCCPPNCDKCCNKCKFKNILNQINYILSSAEQMKNVPCACCCACNMPPRKSCCSIKEIKEETVTIKRESVVENDPNKSVKNPIENATNAQSPDLSKQVITETDNILSSPENFDVHSDECKEDEKYAAPARISFDLHNEREQTYPKYSKRNSIKKSKRHFSESTKYHSEAETTDDASNLSEEYKRFSTCVKKQASIVLGEEYVSPSGTFEILIQDQQNKSYKKNSSKDNKINNSNLVFQVDYTTYLKPKCDVENEI